MFTHLLDRLDHQLVK